MSSILHPGANVEDPDGGLREVAEIDKLLSSARKEFHIKPLFSNLSLRYTAGECTRSVILKGICHAKKTSGTSEIDRHLEDILNEPYVVAIQPENQYLL